MSGDGKDEMSINNAVYTYDDVFDPDQNIVVLNFTTPFRDIYELKLKRHVDSIPSFGYKKAPGFKLKWGFVQQEPRRDAKYTYEFHNLLFKR